MAFGNIFNLVESFIHYRTKLLLLALKPGLVLAMALDMSRTGLSEIYFIPPTGKLEKYYETPKTKV